MADKITFWKGVSAGFLAGMTVAAALRYTKFEKFITNLSTVDGKLDRSLEKLEDKLNHSPAIPIAASAPVAMPTPIAVNFAFRRNLADDRDVSIAETVTESAPRTDAVANFLRNGGLQSNGRPQQSSTSGMVEVADEPTDGRDHIDLSKPLARPTRAYARNLDLGSAG